jgi:hypothetical protein
MNKRIKELAEQAGYTKDMFGVGHWDMPECQKFAELIIGHATECVRDVLRDEDSDLSYTAATQVQNKIKQFFGVEETKGWVCPKCGTDRTKAVCPKGHHASMTGDCPMVGVAQ